MSFKNLEERFNANVNKLYAGAKTKFDNGRPSNGANDDPLIVRNPGDGYFGAASRVGGRALPVSRGITFLAKQQLLQTGNTFEQTRLINPVFAIGNAVPFLHLRRHLRPLDTLLKKTDTSYDNVKKLGQLQKETYEKYTNEKSPLSFLKKIPGIGQTLSAVTAKKNVGEELGWEKSRPELGKSDDKYINANKLIKPPAVSGLLGAIATFVSAVAKGKFTHGGFVLTNTFVLGQTYGPISIGEGKWNGNYTTYLKYSDNKKQWTLQLGNPISVDLSDTATNKSLNTKLNGSDIPQVLKKIREDYQNNKRDWFDEVTNNTGGLMPYLKYFVGDNESITDGRQFDPSDGDTGTNAKYLAESRIDKSKKISYIKDPSNIKPENLNTDVSKPAYQRIQNTFDDPIVVSFAMGNDGPIRFRAFITDLQQSATPEYKSYQYIGRMEKFINYVGVQREISFKLGLIAFSKDEVEGVWRRVNYLTGLVYPYGFNRGIFQPNIVRLTIGNVYVNQPGYISSLNTNFNQIAESWELDSRKQVPISALMDIKFTLIEKQSRIADSPFYGITEEMTDGFSRTIPIPPNQTSATDVRQPPANSSTVIQGVRGSLAGYDGRNTINTTG
jgi:hypothetical protein